MAATCEFEADPSHAEIQGLPDHADDAAMVVGDLLAECTLPPLFSTKVD